MGKENPEIPPEALPEVEVIVPVLNGGPLLRACVHALLAQTRPARAVWVVDNGSTDGTWEWLLTTAEREPRLRPLRETTTRGSYAARNLALTRTTAPVIAFTDADCLPVPHWLEAGLRTLATEPADLAGGRVRFTFAGPRPSGAEWVDSTTNMQMEADIRLRGVTKTANLFVRREVVERTGLFPAHLQSGGDVQWTGAAVAAGFRLAYAPEAEVGHPARGWAELWKKQLRVGRGQIPVMRARGLSGWAILAESLDFRDRRKGFRPASPSAHHERPPRPWTAGPAKIFCRLGTLVGRALHCAGW